jgi:hypothetical protein
MPRSMGRGTAIKIKPGILADTYTPGVPKLVQNPPAATAAGNRRSRKSFQE